MSRLPHPVCWPVDALIKVFREDEPGKEGKVIIESARNEFESGQIAVRSDKDTELQLTCSPLKHRSKDERLQCMPRFVGYVKVKENVRKTPPEEIIHPAPAEFPDYLMQESRLRIQAGQTQPIWLTVFIPTSASPGTYRGMVSVRAGGVQETSEIQLTVHKAAVSAGKSLYLTNWMNPGNIAKFAKVEPWGDDHWKLLASHATSMALHRQNVILTPLGLIEIRRKGGKMSFDFAKFDRWVRLFRESGVDGLIEGGHMAGRSGDWKSGFSLESAEIVEDGARTTLPRVPVESKECEAFLSQFLPALQQHLQEQGWVDSYVQHLADEPIDANAESYRHLADLVKKYAPRLRRIDATMTPNVQGCLEVWVPVLDQFDRSMAFHQERMKAGDEVWFYTCLGPAGKYPNRFIDFSLLKVRLLHWLNFRYGLPGYLHWGYNHWTEDPFNDTQPMWSHGALLPAGDMCIVYPGPRGPIESLRYEAMRDGVEDYELLKALAQRKPNVASRICERIVRSPTDYERGTEEFRDARGRLLEMLDVGARAR